MAQELGKTFEKYLWGDLILVKFQTFAFNFTTLLSSVCFTGIFLEFSVDL